MLPLRFLVYLLLSLISLVLIVILYDSLFIVNLKLKLIKWNPSVRKSSRSNSQFKAISNSDIRTKFGSVKTYNCSKPARKFSEIQRNNEHWQVVRRRNIYIYSAYYDVRYRYENTNYHFVRILASAEDFLQEPVDGLKRDHLFCHLWFNDTKGSTIVDADVQEIWMKEYDPNSSSKTYHSYLISCPIPHKLKLKKIIPTHVSVSANYCEQLTNYLPVSKDGLQEIKSGDTKDRYIICVKGMNFAEDISGRLVEWMELNLMLGASGADFYVYSVHEKVRKVLEYYESIGVANVIDITLPGDQPNDGRRDQYLKYNLWQKRRSELIPYNDCLYRNMYSYHFVVPLDIDEILMPKNELNWATMFRKLFQKDPHLLKKYASFSASNVYFYDKWNTTKISNKTETTNTKIYANPNTFVTKENKSKFHMLNHLTRTANFSLSGHHVKSFISTKNTLLTFNHYSLKPLYFNMSKYILLDKEIIQLNHYQDKCSRYIISQCIKNFDIYSTEDDIILKYEENLTEKVLECWKKINTFS